MSQQLKSKDSTGSLPGLDDLPGWSSAPILKFPLDERSVDKTSQLKEVFPAHLLYIFKRLSGSQACFCGCPPLAVKIIRLIWMLAS